MLRHADRFAVVYCRGDDLTTLQVIKRGLRSVVEARNARVVSGDLVVIERTGKVVPNTLWLWSWERADPKSYARQMLSRWC